MASHNAVSAPDPDAISSAVKKATDAGIPVITLNSGLGDYQKLGAITHVDVRHREARTAVTGARAHKHALLTAAAPLAQAETPAGEMAMAPDLQAAP